jgi:geranylgeranyl diphosphate synthase, type I
MVLTIDDQFTTTQLLLRGRLEELLTSLEPALQADVIRALEAEGKLLWRPAYQSGRPAGVWGLLTLLVAQHLSCALDARLAASVAIAVELYMCSLDLLDDVEDFDQTPVVAELGVPRVLSVATALLFLSQRALLSTATDTSPEYALRLLDALSATSLIATSGQHRDILTAGRSAASMSEQECIEILAKKSASLMALACRLGALCAGADAALCEEWAQLGVLLGASHQLDNDAHDDYDSLLVACVTQREPTHAPARDGRRYTKTLPVVLAWRLYQQHSARAAPVDVEEDRAALGVALREAIMITSGKAALYRERVREAVVHLSGVQPLPPALCTLLGFPAP